MVLTLVEIIASAADYIAFPPHPCLLVNSNELESLRAEIGQPGWKRNIYLSGKLPDFRGGSHAIRSNADLWLHREIVIPARGGHYHWFFCEDGTQLTPPANQEFVPGPYRCPACGKTYSGEKYESVVRRLVHGWLSVAALDLALVAALEHKPEYAAKSAEILCKYAEAYPGPHTGLTEGGMVYQSLDESMWIIPLAQAFDLIHAELSPAQQSKITHFLKVAAEGIQRCGTGGNWGSWHLSAVGVVGYATTDTNLVRWATKAFKEQIRNQLGDDGLWPESVHTYHFFPLQAFQFFAEAAWHAGVDLYRWPGKPGKSLASMYSAPLEYAYPNLQLAAINDGWYNAFLPPDCYELAWHRLHDPPFAWVLARSYDSDNSNETPRVQRDGLYAFLFGKELPPQVAAPVLHSINFPILGICVLRSTNGTMMTFDYGPLLGHGQPDKMGITFFGGGKLWAADYGTPGYGAEILPWYRSTFAHNTIIVDNQNQKKTSENAANLWLGDTWLEAVRSVTKEAYPGVTHTRTLVRLGDCFIVRDQLESRASHDYDFYLHAEGALQLNTPDATGPAQPAPLPWMQDVRAFPKQSQVSAVWQDDARAFSASIIGNHELAPMKTRCPAEIGGRLVDLLIVRQTGNSAEFITALCPPGKIVSIKQTKSHDELQLTGSVTGKLRFPTGNHAPKFIAE